MILTLVAGDDTGEREVEWRTWPARSVTANLHWTTALALPVVGLVVVALWGRGEPDEAE